MKKLLIVTVLLIIVSSQDSLAQCRRTFHYRTPSKSKTIEQSFKSIDKFSCSSRRSKTIEESFKSINTFNKPPKHGKSIEKACDPTGKFKLLYERNKALMLKKNEKKKLG